MARPAGQGVVTRAMIIRKAAGIFEQKGYAAATIEDICAVAKVSKGNIYYHFGSKEGLFIAVLSAAADDWRRRFLEMSAPLTSAVLKLQVFTEHFAADSISPLMGAAAEFMANYCSGKGKEALDGFIRQDLPLLEGVLREGVESGELRPVDPKETAAVLYSFLYGLNLIYRQSGRERYLSVQHSAEDLMLRGLLLTAAHSNHKEHKRS